MKKSRVIMAIASGGGHWVQLLRLTPAFAGCDIHFVTTLKGVSAPHAGCAVSIVKDASRSDKPGLLLLLSQLFWLLITIRPAVIVTTGAAPGVIALRLGKLLGMRTVWIDSIANVEELSLSGRLAGGHADLWLTQWPHLATQHAGLQYKGAVI